MNNLTSDIKQYLSSMNLQQTDKEYTFNFSKKTAYLDAIKQNVINEIHSVVTSGYGDVNSKICFVFNSEEDFKLLKPVLQGYLDTIKLNLWDIYVTFINKTPTEYANKYAYLVNELYAVHPSILYIVDNDEETYNIINKAFVRSNIPYPATKSFFVSRQLLCATEQDAKKNIWKMFKYLINYRE